MANPNISKLDLAQLLKRVIDGSDETVRAKLVETESEISISKDDDDSVFGFKGEFSQTATVNNAFVGDTVIAEVSCKGLDKIRLYLKNDSTPNVIAFNVEVSPVDTGDFWKQELSLSNTGSGIDSSSITELVARRIRVVKSGNITTGSVSVALVGK